jgi:hypothetical protein
MTTQNRLTTRTVFAGNDFRAVGLYLAVDHPAANTGVNFSTAGGRRAIGILQSRPNSGQHGTVAEKGVLKACAGAVVTTPGYPLTTAASGYLVAAVSGDTIVGLYNPPPGGAVACASGDLINLLAAFNAKRQLGAGSGYV